MAIKRVLGFAVGPIGGAFLAAITVPVLTWFYPVEAIGRYSMLQIGIAFALMFFSLGLDQAYVREFHAAQFRSRLFWLTFLPGLVVLLGSALISVAVSPALAAGLLFDADDELINLVFLIIALLAFTTRFLAVDFRMMGNGFFFSLSQLLPKLFFLGGVVILVQSRNTGSFESLLVVQAVSYVLVLLAVLCARRLVSDQVGVKEGSQPELKQLLKFSFPLLLGGLAYWGATHLDRLYLKSFAGFHELGIYAVAVNFASVGVVLQSLVSVMWAPIAYRWASDTDVEQKVDRVATWALRAIVAIFSLCGLLSWLLPFVLPPQYRQVEYLFMACMALPLFYTLSEVTSVGIGISRKSHWSLVASMLMLLIVAIAGYWVIPRFGARGAACVLAVSAWQFFVLRTEFSARCWRMLPRKHHYFVTMICCILVVGFALIGQQAALFFYLAWSAMLIGLVATSRHDIVSLIKTRRLV